MVILVFSLILENKVWGKKMFYRDWWNWYNMVWYQIYGFPWENRKDPKIFKKIVLFRFYLGKNDNSFDAMIH